MERILSAKLQICAIAVMVSLLFSACSSSGCTDNKSSIPLAGFYSYSTLSAISVSSISIGGVDAPNDSLIIDDSSASEVYLPFRAGYDNTQFYIHYNLTGIDDTAYNDTLSFSYNRVPYFASSDCGAMYKYEITQFTTTYHLIDSIALVDSCITNVDRETIKIFFRTYTAPTTDETGSSEDADNSTTDTE
jgi:hypothetical protein